MALKLVLGSFQIFLGLCGLCTGFVMENCTDVDHMFKNVFTVPGDIAMLNSIKVSSDMFNLTTVPYNNTWYASKTSQEVSNLTSRFLILDEILLFLNVTLDDDGEYINILRTPSDCYKQSTKLVVNMAVTGQCGKQMKTIQNMWNGVNNNLNCPLKENINKLKSYKINTSLTWYKGCDAIEPNNNESKYTYRDTSLLMIDKVQPQNSGNYTCTLKVTVGGITGSMSETIDARVKVNSYSLAPQIHEPANETIKTQKGSNFSKRCKVFVPGYESPVVFWSSQNNMFYETYSSQRVHETEKRNYQDFSKQGRWFERWIIFSKVTEKDFHIKYTCKVHSNRGHVEGYFILLPADTNVIITIGSVLGSVTPICCISVIVYYIFKIDIVLWFRRVFALLYTNKDLDGKLYDAYVAHPQLRTDENSKEVETFALYTLPQVLEDICGYKLFIAGRDCLPGQAFMDSVEENMQTSRCFILLYNASTFTSKDTSTTSPNNKNIAKNGSTSDNGDSKTKENSNCRSFGVSDDIYPDARQQLEFVTGMHRTLLEASLKVILVELEEITPAQLALFPESVRHLRKKQGAVCWWKTLKRKRNATYFRSRDDKEKCEQDRWLSKSLSPSSKFWKEIRYHMPVNVKRVVYPEKTALLNL